MTNEFFDNEELKKREELEENESYYKLSAKQKRKVRKMQVGSFSQQLKVKLRQERLEKMKD